MTNSFEIIESKKLLDVKIISSSVFCEERGSIWTTYKKEIIDTMLPFNLTFKHDKFSSSKFNVLRGIHGDYKSWKLVTCIYGSIKQVVVDMRKDSISYLQWESFDLGDKSKLMILLPPGMGNAFYVKSKVALYHYKLAYSGEYIDADKQFTIAWNDQRFNIDWPTDNPVLSERDRNA